MAKPLDWGYSGNTLHDVGQKAVPNQLTVGLVWLEDLLGVLSNQCTIHTQQFCGMLEASFCFKIEVTIG